jgi:hypothetical protein
MKAFKKFTLRGVNFFFLIVLLSSCLEDNFTDISLDDSIQWEPNWSVPVGEASMTVENYFNSLAYIDSFPIDTFFVYFEDSLYRLDVPVIETEEEIDFSLSELASAPSNILYLKIKVITENSFPASVKNQVYFYGENGVLIDSLFSSSETLKPGTIDAENARVVPSREITEVEIDTTRIDNIFQTDQLRIKSAIQLSPDDMKAVTFKESYDIHIKMGLQARLSISPSF